ncbi:MULTISPECIES: RBBP9/YdeN family alpha/beta hydrolase [Streptomyces]|uniref:Hydrolase n=1 Tax=Streptomyces argyrophylli TaxID=2726118 RepID=A0A6M4PQ81_9ACTN|nr:MULTISPECIES: alpha/beta hydrolase [Streptomyces]QJS11826.1 hydrolase [Streptomyces argyrophyllae]
MTTRAYLILHGWQNHRPPEHWQHWLAGRLTALGHRVGYPQLPDADDPDLDVWLGELARHLEELNGPEERVVVAHSLSAVLWLHAAARRMEQQRYADRVLLVSPPSGPVLARYPEVAAFAPPAPGFTLPGPTRLVAGDDDPYCPGGADTVFAGPLGIPADILPGAAHLDLDAGYGPWPAVLDWCVGGTTPLTARPAPR